MRAIAKKGEVAKKKARFFLCTHLFCSELAIALPCILCPKKVDAELHPLVVPQMRLLETRLRALKLVLGERPSLAAALSAANAQKHSVKKEDGKKEDEKKEVQRPAPVHEAQKLTDDADSVEKPAADVADDTEGEDAAEKQQQPEANSGGNKVYAKSAEEDEHTVDEKHSA